MRRRRIRFRRKGRDRVVRACRVTAFEGKAVLVTGASRGIGKSIALRFAELGAKRVGVSYLRNDRAAEETAKELQKLGAEPLLLRGNVGDPDKAAALVEEAGPLDVIVSNAATGVIRPALEIEEKHWDWTVNANARALLTLVRAAAPTLQPGASIIAISSLGSTRVLDDYVVVGVSKAALEALVRYLAVELAPRGIRVNAVSAGLVETGALEYFKNRDSMLDYYRRRTPAGRLVDPQDVAAVVCFLASPEADMIRGQTVVVDGGYSVLA
jgi:enoyl-[acyl-carrier protein] reductase III